MLLRRLILLVLLVCCLGQAWAQKPFTEGVISYKVKLITEDNKEYSGVYTFTFKGPQIKKDLKLNNGFRDVMLMNCNNNTVYTLQTINGKKYAIQLNMTDLAKRQERYGGYTMQNETGDSRNIAGLAVYRGDLSYKDGTATKLYYTKEWYPAHGICFERFPDAKFLPLNYSYKDEQGVTMQFEADKVNAGPVENAVFRIPPDYKMISNEEYKQLSR